MGLEQFGFVTKLETAPSNLRENERYFCYFFFPKGTAIMTSILVTDGVFSQFI